MRDKVKVLTALGTMISLDEWQKIYGLKIGSNQVGKHFSLDTDLRLKLDIYEFGELIVCETLMRLMDAVRIAWGKSLKINSYNRSEDYQRKLKLQGYRTAATSPHVAKLAVDLDTISFAQSRELAQKVKETAAKMGIQARIGYLQYIAAKQTFIHLDVCPEYYAKGKPMHALAHPEVWEKERTW